MTCFHQHLVKRLDGRCRRQMSSPTTRRQLHERIDTRWGSNPSLRRLQNQQRKRPWAVCVPVYHSPHARISGAPQVIRPDGELSAC
ncbi:hypothetical protein CDEST_12372 [Colletotrichum destructivum]|uniref:Uncharacterized protein n=1 Tax=Colletotrichum destructivum TaxID=34406 RepID=A0AAX4IVR5_9PEZI|nr:hypothetical protein CDEST_12372 [Colletotrichum destructivum]